MSMNDPAPALSIAVFLNALPGLHNQAHHLHCEALFTKYNAAK